eukprot:gb/GECG01004125.1/.p1 GENE.gb/GECG01004125.1/~~gb/GECG01004125.1/.p1  ORF type:complete len:673 (+),score=57.91 gb/GECG01004125.1/:1-2019(+)
MIRHMVFRIKTIQPKYASKTVSLGKRNSTLSFKIYTRYFGTMTMPMPHSRPFSSCTIRQETIDDALEKHVETLVPRNSANLGPAPRNLVALLSRRLYSEAKYDARELLALCVKALPRESKSAVTPRQVDAMEFIWKSLVELAPGLLDHFDSLELKDIVHVLVFLKQKCPQGESHKLTRSLLLSALLSLEDISYRRQQTGTTKRRQSRSKYPWPLRLDWNSMSLVKDVVLGEDRQVHDLLFLSWLSSRMVYEDMGYQDLSLPFRQELSRVFRRCTEANHVTCTKKLRECLNGRNGTTLTKNPGNCLITPLHLPVQVFACLQDAQADFVHRMSSSFPEDQRLFLLQASAITGMFHRVQFIQVAKRWGEQFGHLPPRVVSDGIAAAGRLIHNHEACRAMLPSTKTSGEKIAEEGRALYFMCSALCHTVWIRLKGHHQKGTVQDIELATEALELMLYVHEESAMKQQHVVRLLYELRNTICSGGLKQSRTVSEQEIPWNLLSLLIRILNSGFRLCDQELWKSIALALEEYIVDSGVRIPTATALRLCRNCVDAFGVAPRLSTTTTHIIASLGSHVNESGQLENEFCEAMDEIGMMYHSCLHNQVPNSIGDKVIHGTDKLLVQLLHLCPMQAYASLPSLSADAISGYSQRKQSQLHHVQDFAAQAKSFVPAASQECT